MQAFSLEFFPQGVTDSDGRLGGVDFGWVWPIRTRLYALYMRRLRPNQAATTTPPPPQKCLVHLTLQVLIDFVTSVAEWVGFDFHFLMLANSCD